MQKYISILFILVFLLTCSPGNEIQWRVSDNEVIIQLYEPDLLAEEYYAEITNEEGRRFAVNIGLPDKERKFRIGNDFGKIVKVEITSNLDFE
jgi:hypothetical protein